MRDVLRDVLRGLLSGLLKKWKFAILSTTSTMVGYVIENVIAGNELSELEIAVLARNIIINMLQELQATEPGQERDFKERFLNARLADAQVAVGAAILRAQQQN